jgi:hypothetical protein
MTSEELVRRYPRLFHVAWAGSWDGIANYGLLSTTALLDLYEYRGSERERIQSGHRPKSRCIRHSRHGTAVIRDQAAMSPTALQRCLDQSEPPRLSAREWFELLNRHVFFWATRERLDAMLHGRLYRNKVHCVITVETARLVARHGAEIRLCRFDSRSTLRGGATPSRGLDTFERSAAFSGSSGVAEVSVTRRVPDILDVAIRVEKMRNGEALGVIWQPN